MTDKREEMLQFIIKYKSEHNGNSPSVPEIGDACEIAISSVFYHLNIMVKEGVIRRDGGGVRNIEVIGGEWSLQKE